LDLSKSSEKGDEMADEMELAQLLDQFVDDLNNGRVPRIYELMVSDPETVAELIPLLDLAAWFKTSNLDKEEG
jgi:hypothetical protein